MIWHRWAAAVAQHRQVLIARQVDFPHSVGRITDSGTDRDVCIADTDAPVLATWLADAINAVLGKATVGRPRPAGRVVGHGTFRVEVDESGWIFAERDRTSVLAVIANPDLIAGGLAGRLNALLQQTEHNPLMYVELGSSRRTIHLSANDSLIDGTVLCGNRSSRWDTVNRWSFSPVKGEPTGHLVCKRCRRKWVTSVGEVAGRGVRQRVSSSTGARDEDLQVREQIEQLKEVRDLVALTLASLEKQHSQLSSIAADLDSASATLRTQHTELDALLARLARRQRSQRGSPSEA
jgi:hypothetical protein